MFKQLRKVDNLANIESEVRKINFTSDNEPFMSDKGFLENVCEELKINLLQVIDPNRRFKFLNLKALLQRFPPAESSEDIHKLIPKEFDLYQLAKLNEEQLEKGLENFWIDTLLNKDTKLRT